MNPIDFFLLPFVLNYKDFPESFEPKFFTNYKKIHGHLISKHGGKRGECECRGDELGDDDGRP